MLGATTDYDDLDLLITLALKVLSRKSYKVKREDILPASIAIIFLSHSDVICIRSNSLSALGHEICEASKV
ncbi:CLUMA_CG001249, isoform A [Clunio marinus]|uniref:CLUMA_CG001249, isoform A n=1 Tax=Clunio marinus TaxID=568069 RepID=A0A1J1HHE4_9DIPT|nr:CLUMA_CG001249, isoform A [Clunio marinus]